MAKGARGRGNRGAEPSDLPIFIGLVALAWIHRLFFLFSNLDATWPFTIFYEGDSETFYNYARAILNGTVYDGGIPFHPPAFPHVLSFIHTLIGAGPGVERVPYVPLKIVMALVGSVPIGLGYLLARPYLGRAVALTASMISLYSFGLYVLAVAPVSESLYQALLLLSLLVWTRKLRHPLALEGSGTSGRGENDTPSAAPEQATARPGGSSRHRPSNPALGGSLAWGAILGCLLGLLCLTRAEGMLVALLLLLIGAGSAVFALRRGAPAMGSLGPWIAVAVAMIVVIAPWTIRNAARLHEVNTGLAGQLAHPLPEFVPITAYGPLNFALANNELAKGTFSRDILTSQAQSATLDIRDPQHLELFLHGYEIGWRFIREHPGRFAHLVLTRWGLFFDSLRLGWTQWNLPGGLDGVRRPVDLFVPDSAAGLWINVALIVCGLALLLRRALGKDDGGSSILAKRWLALVSLVTVCGMAATGLFFGYARLGVLLLPIWFTLAAITIAAIARAIPAHVSFSRLRIPIVLAGMVAVLFLIEAWGATGDRNYRATGTQAEGAGHLNPHDTMHLEVISQSD